MLKMNEMMIRRYPEPADTMEVMEIDIGDAAKVIDFTGLVMIREDVYRRITDEGTVKMIEEGIYNDFDGKADPTDLISFAQWQLDKLPLRKAQSLWDYIYWGLRVEKPEHPYKAQWEAFRDILKGYIDEHQAMYRELQIIERVFPVEGNRVYCLCRDRKFRIYDAAWAVECGKGAFESLKDPAFFRERIGVINGTLAWDRTGDKNPYECIDIDPEAIYDSKCLEMEKMVAIVDAVLNGKSVPEDLLK